MKKLVIVSNRLPVTIKLENDNLLYYPSAGGLATGLNSVAQNRENLWFGWPGLSIEEAHQQDIIREDLKKQNMFPVFLSEEDFHLYYEGFSNKVIWPHFHYFTQYTQYEETYWQAYQSVNAYFAEVICEHLQGDELVWVHDYHLMLLPALIRAKFPDISIGFFLHIPFPSYEIFRMLPWREDLLNGLLGADLVGFHTFSYMRHFLSCVYRLAGYEHDIGYISKEDRLVHVDVFPMGIDYEKFATASAGQPDTLLKTIRQKHPHQKIILSVDRLDYSKGIPQRVKAFEQFLSQYPEYLGQVTLFLVAVPSRSGVEHYQQLKEEIDTLVGRINGQYARFDWTPIEYYYRGFPFSELLQLYRVADMALITPLRDGMNLIAKEYVSTRQDKKGVLILSEMAGASYELSEALLINPQNQGRLVEAIRKALTMSETEQAQRLAAMQTKIKTNDVKKWAKTFIDEQLKLIDMQAKRKTRLLTSGLQNNFVAQFAQANRRLLLLDYDGTLVNFQINPKEAQPDESLLALLTQLAQSPQNQVVIISGRQRDTLETWLGHLPIDISAEHGVWARIANDWERSTGLTDTWKEKVRPALETLVERTAGSFIEEKEYSMAWHYRSTDRELGEKRVREIRDVLQYLTANLGLKVLEGNKVIEIKNEAVNKGQSALKWLSREPWDFVLAIGDDLTDEDIFKVMPEEGLTIKVGLDQSGARYYLNRVEEVRRFLAQLA